MAVNGKSITQTIAEIVHLLRDCNYSQQADWFETRLTVLKTQEVSSEVSQIALRELKNVIAGMGSLSDLSMIPKDGCLLSREKANELKGSLSDQLDEQIATLLHR